VLTVHSTDIRSGVRRGGERRGGERRKGEFDPRRPDHPQ